MDMNMPVNVPVDDPNADTEWNDILRKHGVIPEKPPSPTPMIEEALTEARRLAYENRLEGKDLDELDELEDDEDEIFLDQYRQKRMNELATLQNASIYNQVYPVQKPDYSREVTETSQSSFVFVLLTSSTGTNPESQLMIELWRELARRFGDVKFCQMQANLCIEGYPDRNTPTVLVYKDGEIKKQIVTLQELAGTSTGMKDLEQVLVQLGAIRLGDSRLKRGAAEKADERHSSIRQSEMGKGDDGDDSDWD
nr:phosducin-like protein 2 [Quercus suber]